MTRTLLVLSLFAVSAVQLRAGDSGTAPFATVVRQGETIVATLPSIGTRYVVGDTPEQRVTSYGESFRLRDGASVSLYEKHSSFRITCQISPPPGGLKVQSTFNAQSFGGTTTTKTYFIKAVSSHAKSSNQAMQRTAGRSAFPLTVTSTSYQQPRALSPAVADLVSR
jgi:hypothetical protein